VFFIGLEIMSQSKNTDGVDSLLLQAQILDMQDLLSDGAGPVPGHDLVYGVPVNSYVIPQDAVASTSDTSVQRKPNVIVIKKYEHAMTELRQGIICPKCQEICQPPFMSCPDGHLFCNECIKGLKKCEKCEHENLTNRQLLLENVAMAMYWNCDFQKNGCKAVVKLNMLKEHRAQCRYKTHCSCVVNGCKHDVPLDKHAFVKHMKDVHKCHIVNIGINKNFKTFFKVNDYLKQKIDCKKEFQTLDIIEINDNFFCILVLETMDTISFQSYSIGDSVENESGFHCYRAFKDSKQKCLYQSIDSVISITETVGAKRNHGDCASMFVMDKKRAHFLHKNVGDSENVLECFMKIVSHPRVAIHRTESI